MNNIKLNIRKAMYKNSVKDPIFTDSTPVSKEVRVSAWLKFFTIDELDSVIFPVRRALGGKTE